MSIFLTKQCLTRYAIPRATTIHYRPSSLHYSTVQQQQQQQQQPVSKIKQLMKKYGYVGLGTYLTLSALDLSLTMAVIQVAGADKVQQAEHYVMGKLKGWVGMAHAPLDKSQLEKKPSFASLFLVAYSIHKTIMLPVRLSLTAAITPAVAKRVQHWSFWLKKKK